MKIKNCILIEAFKCNEDDSIIEVAKKFRTISLRHIFVVDDNDYPIGVISVTDIINRVVAEGKDIKNTKAKEIMSKPIDVVDVEDDLEEFYETLKIKNHVMAPVVKDEKMIGIITIHQIIKNLEK